MEISANFNDEMSVESIEIKLNQEEIKQDPDTMENAINTELLKSYSVKIQLTEQYYNELVSKGLVKIVIGADEEAETDDGITEELDDEIEITSSSNIAKKDTTSFVNNSSEYQFARGINRLAGEILADYLEKDWIIVQSVIRRGMAVYKTSFEIQPNEVYKEVRNAGNLEIKLLHQIANDVEVCSTGMDSRNCVSIIEQEKDGFLYLRMEIQFKDGNVIAKYKMCQLETIRNSFIDISF